MNKQKFYTIIAVVFIALSIVFYIVNQWDPAYKLPILIIANALMAVLCGISYVLVTRSISDNPHAFVRGVNGASLLKLMVCMIAALIYIGIYRSQVHKPTIFVMFGIYIVYTGIETYVLSGLARVKKDK